MDMRVASTEVVGTTAMPPAGAGFYSWTSGIAVVMIVLGLAAAGWWWWRAPAITVVQVTRGPAAEIVYATGAVEPETWSRSTPLVRGRIPFR